MNGFKIAGMLAILLTALASSARSDAVIAWAAKQSVPGQHIGIKGVPGPGQGGAGGADADSWSSGSALDVTGTAATLSGAVQLLGGEVLSSWRHAGPSDSSLVTARVAGDVELVVDLAHPGAEQLRVTWAAPTGVAARVSLGGPPAWRPAPRAPVSIPIARLAEVLDRETARLEVLQADGTFVGVSVEERAGFLVIRLS